MIIYGKQPILYIIKHHPLVLESIYLAKECDKKLFSTIANTKVPIQRLDSMKAQALAKGGNHQGFLAKISNIDTVLVKELKEKESLLLLYGLTDMGNIGAICRSAYALGVDGIIVSNVQNLKLDTIIRTSSGAAIALPIAHEVNAQTAINELKQAGFTIYGASAKGQSVKEVKFSKKRVLLLGSEGEGIPNKILSKCDKEIAIPMARAFDSLNVSAAAAILCDRMSDG